MIKNQYSFVVENRSFYIQRLNEKPKKHISSIETLRTIERILKEKLPYCAKPLQDVIHCPPYERLNKLGEMASQIHEDYKRKIEKYSAFRKYANKAKTEALQAIHLRIKNYILPPPVLPLPEELIQKILEYLKLPSLVLFAQLNRDGTFQAGEQILKRAKKLGYIGNAKNHAFIYLQCLFKEVEAAVKCDMVPKKYMHDIRDQKPLESSGGALQTSVHDDAETIAFLKQSVKITEKQVLGLLPRSYEFYNHKHKMIIDPEDVLHNLKQASREDVVNILVNKKCYMDSFQRFRQTFKQISTSDTSISAPNTIQEIDSKALFLAARHGDKNVIKLLLASGVDVNAKDESNCTPLLLAIKNIKCEFTMVDVVKFLIFKGADINAEDLNADTPLMLSPYAEVTRLLLESGKLTTLDHMSHSGNALHCAVKREYRGIENQSCQQVELLLSLAMDINARDKNGRTALMMALIDRKEGLATLLVEKGADVNVVDNLGETPLMRAKSIKMTSLLLKSGRLTTIDHVNTLQKNRTALHSALATKNFRQSQLLIASGADIHIRDRNGCNALIFAIQNRSLEIVKILIAKGADVNAADVHGSTPLIYAPNLEMTRVLVESGRLTTIDHISLVAEKASALHCAVLRGDTASIDFLFQWGADKNVRDVEGSTPLTLAKRYKMIGAKSLLLSYGADV
jgi:ankyrin repeat protein